MKNSVTESGLSSTCNQLKNRFSSFIGKFLPYFFQSFFSDFGLLHFEESPNMAKSW